MSVAPCFEKAFRRIYGKPCWCVAKGYGSFLTLEFGKPHLNIREPVVASRNATKRVRESLARRRVYPRGEWHLWIYCCDWDVFCKGRRVGGSSTDLRIRAAADVLDGQKLIRFSISSRTAQCSFRFDLGAVLTTRPFDRWREQWLFYEPSGKVLILRADGFYKHVRSDVPDRQEKWMPVYVAAAQHRSLS